MTSLVAGERGAELRGLRQAQRLAYACAEAVAAQLGPGVTERGAARMQHDWLRRHGVRDRFRPPLAWFGDRTAFARVRTPLRFFPTGRRLERGMPFILHVAPVYRGHVADAVYSGCLGLDPVHDRLLADLREHRELILREVRERRPLREIHQDVDRLTVRQGYAGRHRARPFGAIAREAGRVRDRRRSPLWPPYGFSGRPPRPGVWAVGPHLGFRGTGATFEELLVVTDARDPEESAFWLDDDLPHVRRWTEGV
ncbi:M24 family metallopeptidase [Streptomyces sp. WAC05374]|uniref:M24 family metallopeptidase n=1 Tax=Streptomyces sp. WAC05374 TaxID=2487420 RepID=UPI000F863FF4|nr:M24 family metallopeptidase [Streptomyces sp. WAC05374]RST17859.1 M24 family metallopeptidase [Streptomyces sp. WAC05374]TDF38739.1 M24 family metallopeptidase [Streptomyces sp. WAC05374]TDF56579.1 M24 family metallopeptidase [Streptomyces sp. WAC05374]TDF60045.1 M24 family metallopeptidase [Streptomyces sp. WAC05374]